MDHGATWSTVVTRAVVGAGAVGIVGFAASMLAASLRLIPLEIVLAVGAMSLLVYGAALVLGAISALRSRRAAAAMDASQERVGLPATRSALARARASRALKATDDTRTFTATRPSAVH